MLNYFPKIYKDELFISILKRYHMQSANAQKGLSLIELFNTHITTVHTYVPTNLNILCSNIPDIFNIKADDLIENNTLFNYYTAFVTEERKNEIREKMKQDRGNAFKITKYEDIPLNQYLRYCPKCMDRQFEEMGEIYWNRIHQVAYICTEHNEFIIDSPYKTGGRDLNYYILSGNIISINNKIIEKEMLLKISKRIEELVVNSSKFTHQDLRIIYYQELDKRGYVYKSKTQIYIRELETEMEHYFGKELLFKILKREESLWINRLLHNYTSETHPLYHVLIQEFLDLDNAKINEILNDIESFKNELEDKGFNMTDREPWEYDYINELSALNITCKNVLAEHYKKEEIYDIELHYCYSNQAHMCTFRCSCGFIYTTIYSDVIDSAGEKVGKIKEWGDVYYRELVKLKHLGNKGIARMTGVNAGTIKKQLSNSNELDGDKGLGGVNETTSKDKDIGETVEVSKDKGMGENRQSWREEEWRKKDELYYKKVKELLVQEQNIEDRPIRITKTYIAKQIGAVSAIMYNLDKMPRTKEIIEKNAISREEWRVIHMKYNSDINNR